MDATATTTDPLPAQHATVIGRFLTYLRTFRAPPGLFHPDVVCTYHVPGGHYEQRGPEGLEAELAPYGDGSEVHVEGAEATAGGFVIEFTQRAQNGDLYEELAWARLENGLIRQLVVYCTGVVRNE